MLPSGTFLLLPPLSSLWLPRLVATPAADLLSNRVRQQGEKLLLKLLINFLDGPPPDAARPIRRQWFIWCFGPSVMKRESMGSHGCRDEEQGEKCSPCPHPALALSLQNNWNQRVQTHPFSKSRMPCFQRGRQGCFHLCPPAASASHPSPSGGSPTIQRIKPEPPSMSCENLHARLRTVLPASWASLPSPVIPTLQSNHTPLLHPHVPFVVSTTRLCKSDFLNLERPALTSPFQSINVPHERPGKMSCPHSKTFLLPLMESNFPLLVFFLFYTTGTWGCTMVFLKSRSLWDCKLII